MLEVPIPWPCQVRSLHGLINRVNHKLTVPEENMKIRELEYSFPNCLHHVSMKEIRFNMGWHYKSQGSGKSSWLSLGKSPGYIACRWSISNHMLETESSGTTLFICLENMERLVKGRWPHCMRVMFTLAEGIFKLRSIIQSACLMVKTSVLFITSRV